MSVEWTAALIRAVYETENGRTGCCLHITTDDGNYEDDAVQFCLEQARKREHPLCIRTSEDMLRLTEEQREEANHFGDDAAMPPDVVEAMEFLPAGEDPDDYYDKWTTIEGKLTRVTQVRVI